MSSRDDSAARTHDDSDDEGRGRGAEEAAREIDLPEPSPPPPIPELLRQPTPKADPHVGSRFGSNRGNDTMAQLGSVLAIGGNFAAAVGGGCLLGYFLDRWLKTSPTLLLIGLAAGLIGGGYGFVREAKKATRNMSGKPPRRG